MNPAVQAIPTFGIDPMLTPDVAKGNGISPNILMAWMAGMILFNPATPAVGISGRSCA
jgi:hypothetical protein